MLHVPDASTEPIRNHRKEDPGTVSDLIKVVELWVVGCSLQPHFMDDSKPALSEAT